MRHELRVSHPGAFILFSGGKEAVGKQDDRRICYMVNAVNGIWTASRINPEAGGHHTEAQISRVNPRPAMYVSISDGCGNRKTVIINDAKSYLYSELPSS